MAKTLTDSRSAVAENKFLAFLSYLSFFCIIPLIFKKNRPFIQHHGKQGLVLFVAQVFVFVIHISMGPWFLAGAGFVLSGYAFVGLSCVAQGQSIRLWGVSDLADKITL